MKSRRILTIIAGVLAALLIALWLGGKALSPWAREKFIAAVEDRFASKVEIQNLEIQLFPWFSAYGDNMVFRHKGRTDVPPLIEIKHFTASTSLPQLLFMRVNSLTLDGLRVTVARERKDEGGSDEPGAENNANREQAGQPASANATGTAPQQNAEKDKDDDRDRSKPPTKEEVEGSGEGTDNGPGFVIETIYADGAHIEILPKNPAKQPLEFDLEKLTLHGAGPNSAMSFESTLTNPKPPGDVVTNGEFGPWNKEKPRRTPLSGEYTFTNADLGVFKGISGILSAEGDYKGVLERIEVNGTADVPDFRATGNAVHLKTAYNAIVDGTSGDTYLEPVEATFLKSKIHARGRVAGLPDRKGKEVVLDVAVTEARVEDMLAMAVPLEGEPPLSGPIEFTTKFELPPGDVDVVEKLKLDGRFGLEESTFTNKMQEKVNEFSKKAQGQPEAPPEETAANFEGEFHMSGGAIRFPRINFVIPGANVNLLGSYQLRQKEMDFQGHLLMDAKISEVTTGMKSFFLKMVDPFFRDKGRTSIPIKISGTVKEPKFGLAVGGAKAVKGPDNPVPPKPGPTE